MAANERLSGIDVGFSKATACCLKGERIGYMCLTHRDATRTFKEYVAWLNVMMPMPDDRPTTWWSARRSTLSINFSGGGLVKFVSYGSHDTDGISLDWY